MSYKTPSLVAALALTAGTAFADDHANLKGYALTDDGTKLVTMASLASPGDVETWDLSTRLDAIAYRPVTGDLIGFSKNGALYQIDAATGEMTDLEAEFDEGAMTMGNAVAFDFNNAIDAVRAVGSDGVNLVYFPEEFGDERAGTVKKFTDVFYVEGDDNADAEPQIYANAYTNAISGAKAESTFQYALDAETDALVTLANNAGELETVGKVMIDGEEVDLIDAGGFDIVSPEEGTDMAYAVLQIEGTDTSGLYSIDLDTAEASLISDLGMTGISGFAVSQ